MTDLVIPDTLPGRPDRPLSIGGLTSDAADILRDATDLPRPTSVSIYEFSQHISFQFEPEPDSYAALAMWAELFGATITSRPWTDHTGKPVNVCRVNFEYRGIATEAFALIPAGTAT